MLSAADLQLILLALLEERPRHGYDFLKAIEELTGGAYTPSPGMIYPALSYLDEIGQVTAQPDGAKKQYRLTEAGLSVLNESRERVAALFEDLKRIGERLGIAREVYDQPMRVQPESAPPVPAELESVRRDLKAALFDTLDATGAEQQRIVEILKRTIAEIRKR